MVHLSLLISHNRRCNGTDQTGRDRMSSYKYRPFLANPKQTSFLWSFGLTKTLDFIRPFLANPKQTSFLWSFGLTKTLYFIRPFLANPNQTSFLWSFGLTKTLDFIRPFLANPNQTSFLWSFGLTKTFHTISLYNNTSRRQSPQKNMVSLLLVLFVL